MFFRKKKNDIKIILKTLVRNEIVVTPENNREVPLPDASKFGGKPYLPLDFSWPYYEGENFDGETKSRPLTFLCQINLQDVQKYDRDKLLPKSGMLYFFYEIETMRWGFDGKDKGCARVYYFENCDGFTLADYPQDLQNEYRVKEMPITFSAANSYPSYEELEHYTDAELDFEEYDDTLEAMGYDLDCERHKLLGYADLIQGEMLTECEQVSRGFYCGDGESYRNASEAVKNDIKKAAKDWMLLFQMASIEEDDYEMMWGDLGDLYFYIRKDDLKNKKFENIWLVLQCG